MAQIPMKAHQTGIISEANMWVGLPVGSSFTVPVDGPVVVVPANEFNLVPVNTAPPIQVSPTSPGTVQVSGPATPT
jgi:hypothetical protein